MSLKIYYAHTGDCLVVDPESFNSVDDLKLWISEQINVPPQNQILTTVKGLLVKAQALNTEREFFLYSRQYILSSGSPSAPAFQVPNLTEPQPPPSSLESQNDLGSWRTLFSHRVTWAQSVLAHADSLISSITKTSISISVMERSVDVAASNLNTHVRSAIGEYDELRGWALEALRAQEKLLINWEPSLGKLSKVKIHPEVATIVAQARGSDRPRDRRSGGAQQFAIGTLLDLVNPKEVGSAGQSLQGLAVNFERQMTELGGKVEDVRRITNELEEAMHSGMKNAEDPNPEEPQYLLNDIAAVVQKVQQDYDHVCSLANTPKSIASASKTAHVHTRELLPSLVEMITDMSELRQRVAHRKNKVSQLCVQYLQRISGIEKLLYEDLKHFMKEYEIKYNEDSTPLCQLLALVVYLPSRYSSFMVECVRRREWSDRMKGDGSKLAEELSGLKEEEEKRRKKWYKSTTQGGGLLLEFLPDEPTSSGINVELSVRSDSNDWPKITREDLAGLLEDLKMIPGTESAIKDLAQQIIDLDKPSRRQRKAETPTLATRAFKMGSVHEAAMSSSVFPQGDVDDVTKLQILQAERVKWDGQVRTYESRIRRLEDLLHRARSGNSTGIQFTQHGSSTTTNNTSQPPLSPATAEPLSRNSSQGGPGVAITGINMPGMKRRISQVENIERLAIRIQALESELVAERENSTKLQEEAAKRVGTEKDWSDRFAEADQTKRDLLANLDAQQQEFSSERKGLQEKFRDLEEQLESWKRRVDEVYVELDRIEEARTEDILKKQEVEKELGITKEESEKYKDMAFDHEEELAKAKEEWDEQSKEAASTADRLLSEIFELRGARDHHNKLAAELNDKVAELKSSNESNNDAKVDLEKKISKLEDALQLEQDRHGKALEGHADALAPLRMSYEKLSEALGENQKSPETPKDLVEGIETLTSDLVDRHKATTEKLASEESSSQEMREKVLNLTERFETRTLKARDLTQRLYTHNARCGQLLENLGFSVVLRDGSTQIVRIPRTSNGEPSAEMMHSISMSSTLPPLPDNRGSYQDLDLLYWMEAEDSEIESEKYTTYLNSIGAFDVDAFCEAVRRRVKEAEHMARKWQKQARDYRDKYHRVQAEASEKIAFKSFKEGDLALFLPTRNQITKPWAAFNVGAPHYFLREHDSHKLQARDWLLARISKIEERIVDLSKSTAGTHGTAGDRASINSSEGGASIDEENPFQLSDGLRWYLLDAAEEKPGAPTTPGLSSSTVASAIVDAKGSLRNRKPVTGARKTLSKSLQQSGGPPPTAGESASIRSRGSGASAGRKDSSGAQATSPFPPATPLPEGSAIIDA